MFEIDVRFNRPLNDQTRSYLNHFLDDEGIGLLRWRGDDEHVVLTFLVKHVNREGAMRLVSDQAAMLWPHEIPAGVDDIRWGAHRRSVRRRTGLLQAHGVPAEPSTWSYAAEPAVVGWPLILLIACVEKPWTTEISGLPIAA